MASPIARAMDLHGLGWDFSFHTDAGMWHVLAWNPARPGQPFDGRADTIDDAFEAALKEARA